MLFERPVSLALAGIALALVVPESSELREQSDKLPGLILIPGAVIGAVAAYLGTAVACSYYRTLGRTLRVVAWGCLGVGIGIITIYFGLRAPEWWSRLLFLGTGCLPLFAPVVGLFRGWRKPL